MTTELGPYLGKEVGFPDTQWGAPREEPPFIEGEFRELPEGKPREAPPLKDPSVVEEDLWEYPGEAPSFTREEPSSRGRDWKKEEDFVRKMQEEAEKLGFEGPQTYEEAKEFELRLPRLKKSVEFMELERSAKEEELKAHRRGWKKKYGRDIGKRTFKTYKGLLGPVRSVPRDFYIPKQMVEYYVPGRQVRALTTPPGPTSPVAQINRPDLEGLQRASAPPPTTPIRAPFKDVERQEGLGPALGRLRSLGKFPKVDWEVYSEIHANGDIDTPSHIRSEVRQLGFSRREIDDSLGRLRKLGVIAPTGQVFGGEKELMIVGGTDGH